MTEKYVDFCRSILIMYYSNKVGDIKKLKQAAERKKIDSLETTTDEKTNVRKDSLFKKLMRLSLARDM